MSVHNRHILCCIILLLSVSFVAHAQTINGRLTTTLYSWEQQELDKSTANHVRAYQLARFSVANFGVQGLSLHTYLNLSQDFSEKAVDDPRLWIYNLYLDYRDIVTGLDVNFGRQRIYAGVGYGTIDGLQMKYRMKDYFNLKFYIGTLAPLKKSYEIEDVNSDNISWGLHLTTTKLKKVRLGISYAQMSRTPVQYSSAGIYTGDFRQEHPITSLQKQLFGFDVRGFITSKFIVNGRLDYNYPLEQIKRVETGAHYTFNKNFDVGLDYVYRSASIDLNSIFWVFALSTNQEIGFRTNYRWNCYRLYLNLASVAFDGDNSLRIGFGGSWKNLTIGYNHRSGYSGDSDGVSLNYNYALQKKLNLLLNTHIVSYQTLSMVNDKEQAIAGSFGVNYSFSRFLSMQAQAQFLRNTMFSQDFRFFFRASYAFSHRFNK